MNLYSSYAWSVEPLSIVYFLPATTHPRGCDLKLLFISSLTMAAKTLFTVPIPPLKDHVGGEIVCTEPAPEVYLLTFSSSPDNRLTPAFCGAMLRALDRIELLKPSPTGVVITTSAIPKFYSNGLDLYLAIRTPGFTEDALYPLFHRFLTFPMPTVAVLNGHAFAGGFMLAMHHDYRVFAGDRGYMCINELEFGAPLLPPMSGICKLPFPNCHYYRFADITKQSAPSSDPKCTARRSSRRGGGTPRPGSRRASSTGWTAWPGRWPWWKSAS